MSSHSAGRMTVILVGFVVYAVTLAISYMSSNNAIDIGIFKNSTGDISDKFYLTITPAGWTFGLIWAVIYIYQLVWYVYALTTICRRDNEGNYLYTLSFLPRAFYVVFMANNVVLVVWLVLWDREWVQWALIDIVFAPFTLYVCLFISYKYLYDNIATLRSRGVGKEVWLIRALVHNGMSFFATWVSIATLLNFGVVLTYIWSVDVQLSSTIVLGILSLEILVWFTLETCFIDKYVRYTITPYIVLVVALTGSVAKNFDLDTNNRNSIFTAVLLGVSGLLLITKLFIVIRRHRRYPIKGNINDDVKGTLA
ncbi:uncharacterized protein LOC128559965 [Mercenaria mercenaria]|uniref:uncharacterized protein LOC128559965 n=1 Tax=Mercenaria mercenaria TaxID=6596 RepID=UPI00234F2BDF|nr:uncharacterized protein LOC128559965 [Mercenaria mercenaria]